MYLKMCGISNVEKTHYIDALIIVLIFQFYDSEDAKKALEQLNGFELAGRPMKVGHVTERTDLAQGPSFLDSDELDRTGIDLGATGRLQLMAKLAEGNFIFYLIQLVEKFYSFL